MKFNCCLIIPFSKQGTTADFTHAIDLGDLIEVTGTMGYSKKGTRSLMVLSWRLIGKCLRPLPDKWKGLTDQEARVRARYVDLAINTEARDLIRARSGVLHAIRETLVGKGFLEVETPILQQIHGGANARPFLTHINAYDLDLYLRIAPELYLKRLCVGGVERVFELGRAFRNEGVDFSHNPEFTLLEAYQAHADYNVWIDGCRELIQNAAQAANGEHVFMRPRDGRRPRTGRHFGHVDGQDRARRGVGGAGRTDRARYRPGDAAQAVRQREDPVPDPLGRRRRGARDVRAPGRGPAPKRRRSTRTSRRRCHR